MKTGFICDSGFNIVTSATRDGRKLVAVVLGEPSVDSRNDLATDLLENGFKRYFWKSLFGTSIDGLAIQASLSDSPTHLRDSVCGAGRAKPRAEGRSGQRRAGSTPAGSSPGAAEGSEGMPLPTRKPR